MITSTICRFSALCPNLERVILHGPEGPGHCWRCFGISPYPQSRYTPSVRARFPVNQEGTRSSLPIPQTTLPMDGRPGTHIVTRRGTCKSHNERNHHLDRLQWFHVATLENRRNPASAPNPNKLATLSEHPKALRSPHPPKYTTNAQVLHITLVGSKLFFSPLVQAARRSLDTVLLWWWLLFEGRRRYRHQPGGGNTKVDVLQLGGAPYQTPTGLTVSGLTRRCLLLSMIPLFGWGETVFCRILMLEALPCC